MEKAREPFVKIEGGDVYFLSVDNVKSFTAKNKIVNQNKEIRVIKWVSVLSKIKPEEFVDPNDPEGEESGSNKRKYDPDDEHQTHDGENSQEPQKKKGRQQPETFLDCEWVGCRYNTVDYAVFQDHVKAHLPDVIVKSYSNGSNVYVCLWDLCDFETPNGKMIKTHVNYHAYHTKVKALGKIVLLNDAECYKDSSMRNRIPALPEEFTCLWKNCSLKFISIQDFFDHVKSHAMGERKDKGETMACQWMGCPIKMNNPYSYLRHVQTHSLYRPIACPNCGSTYNDKSAMVVHCERQIKKLEYKCELCPRLFPTPALLQNHFRDHRREFKCTDCDKTFSRKSTLVSHIRQVHLNVRSLQCNLCSYKCTNKNDMRDHLDRHEKKGRKWIGGMEGRLYVCHYCERNYSRATGLTQHLIRSHGYKAVNRSNRYKYAMTDEGVYRLDQEMEELVDTKYQMKISLKGIIKSEEEEVEDKKSFKLVKYVKSEPKYALVKASDEESKIKDILIKQEVEDLEFKKPITRSMRAARKKYFKCRKCKKYVINDDTNNTSHKCEDDIVDTDVDNTICDDVEIKKEPCDQEPSGHIEISIEEVDLQGNVVKIEVVESEEIMVT